MRFLNWWQCGAVGGVGLSLLTLVKIIVRIPRMVAEGVDPSEVVFMPALVFIMGFVCGVLVWAGRGLSLRFGLFGDALLGMVVTVAFFLMCMMLADPTMLSWDRFSFTGLPMLGLGVIVGFIVGAWTGYDLRKEGWEEERKRKKRETRGYNPFDE